jgi:hypothetical protein
LSCAIAGRDVVGPRLAKSRRVNCVVNQHPSSRIAVAVSVAAAVGLATLLDTPLTAKASDDGEELIQRVVEQVTRSGIAVRSTRELRAGTLSGKHRGWMTVETTLTAAGAFGWRVIEEGGSERTRESVFNELLKTEVQAARDGLRDRAALTPDNYRFAALPPGRNGQIEIRLTPRRADSKLVDGVLTVSPDGYPLRLEGRLAKSPSFWVKSVTIVKQYGRFAGVALPTSIESLADLKMFGRATFTMRYRYSEVNGRSVSHAVASAPFVGPTAEILALHDSRSEQ